MENATDFEVEIDTCSWASIGGTTVNLYAGDAVRSVQMAFGLDAFLAIFEDGMTKFARLDIEVPTDENPRENLEARNTYLRQAAQQNPAVFVEASRVFRRLSSEFEEAGARLASIRVS